MDAPEVWMSERGLVVFGVIRLLQLVGEGSYMKVVQRQCVWQLEIVGMIGHTQKMGGSMAVGQLCKESCQQCMISL